MIVFVDSDAIISSLISSTGASYVLLNTKDLELFISNVSVEELHSVIKRLGISQRELKTLIDNKIKTVKLEKTIAEIKSEYKQYVNDINDAHIVAGANASNARFLISYNIKDFKVNKIKNDFNIIVMTPGTLLQYLRSLQ